MALPAALAFAPFRSPRETPSGVQTLKPPVPPRALKFTRKSFPIVNAREMARYLHEREVFRTDLAVYAFRVLGQSLPGWSDEAIFIARAGTDTRPGVLRLWLRSDHERGYLAVNGDRGRPMMVGNDLLVQNEICSALRVVAVLERREGRYGVLEIKQHASPLGFTLDSDGLIPITDVAMPDSGADLGTHGFAVGRHWDDLGYKYRPQGGDLLASRVAVSSLCRDLPKGIEALVVQNNPLCRYCSEFRAVLIQPVAPGEPLLPGLIYAHVSPEVWDRGYGSVCFGVGRGPYAVSAYDYSGVDPTTEGRVPLVDSLEPPVGSSPIYNGGFGAVPGTVAKVVGLHSRLGENDPVSLSGVRIVDGQLVPADAKVSA